MALKTEAKKLIKRLEAINYDEPYWNLEKVTEHLSKHYQLLNVPMPDIIVANNAVRGFQVVKDTAWGAARDAARDAAWDAAWDTAWGAARDAAWGAARDAAWGAARGAARDTAWGAARDAARDAAWDAARDAAWDTAWDTAWVTGAVNSGVKNKAMLKYIEIDMELFKALENGLGWFFPMQDKLVLVPMPRMIFSGDRLHYDHGHAVEWSDGLGFYFLQGVKFDDEKLYKSIINQTITAEEALTIRDSDQRMAAMSMLRPDRLLKQMNAQLIHIGIKGTKLYEVKNFMDTGETQYCMFMIDASTPREFLEWVEPKIGKQGDADLCQANAWGIPLEDYLAIDLEG